MIHETAGLAVSSPEKFNRFFDHALSLHARAVEAAGGLVKRRFRVAGNLVEFRFAGPALVSVLSDAMGHLRTDVSTDATFVIHCWDEETTGVPSPPNFWSGRELYGHGEITSAIDKDRYLHFYPASAAISAGQRSSNSAAVWVRSTKDIPVWEMASPLRALLNWWASAYGYFNVHAAAVGREAGGVLLVGHSGSGKSHAALACFNSELGYAADDNCLLGTLGDPFIASIYSTVKLFEKDILRFPMLSDHAAAASRTSDGKAVFFMHKVVPGGLASGFPLRSVLLPRLSKQRETTFAPAPASQALLLMAPENVLRWPSAGRNAFLGLASVFRATPCYHLNVGTDLTKIPKAIISLLGEV